jgi:hypothetical protein
MLSGELRRLLSMPAPPENQAMFGTPGESVPSVDAEDIRAVWKLSRDAEARAVDRNPELKPGQLVIGVDLMKRVINPEADVRAVWFRGARLGMLMMRFGKQNVQPPAIFFTIFAKLPMKWWEVGVPRHGLF